MEDMVLFWGGKFSQWYNADMVISGVKYCTCEQFMMAEKARTFSDNIALQQIMKTNDPKEQKAIGRKVDNFDADIWSPISREVVYTGNLAKFTQNKDCFDELMETGDKTIVEASPYDKIWGIGLSATDPRALDRNQWQGTNWLGEAIMKVRETLRNLKWEEIYGYAL